MKVTYTRYAIVKTYVEGSL